MSHGSFNNSRSEIVSQKCSCDLKCFHVLRGLNIKCWLQHNRMIENKKTASSGVEKQGKKLIMESPPDLVRKCSTKLFCLCMQLITAQWSRNRKELHVHEFQNTHHFILEYLFFFLNLHILYLLHDNSSRLHIRRTSVNGEIKFIGQSESHSN